MFHQRLLLGVIASLFFLLPGCQTQKQEKTLVPITTEAYPDLDKLGFSLEAYPGPTLAPLPLTPEIPLEAPKPVEGQASISGVLFSYTIQRVLPGTQFYLTRGVGPEKNLLPAIITGPEQGDILAETTHKGQFFINDIPPGNYYMFVWTPQTWTPAQISLEDQTPKLIDLNVEQSQMLGVIYVAWP